MFCKFQDGSASNIRLLLSHFILTLVYLVYRRLSRSRSFFILIYQVFLIPPNISVSLVPRRELLHRKQDSRLGTLSLSVDFSIPETIRCRRFVFSVDHVSGSLPWCTITSSTLDFGREVLEQSLPPKKTPTAAVRRPLSVPYHANEQYVLLPVTLTTNLYLTSHLSLCTCSSPSPLLHPSVTVTGLFATVTEPTPAVVSSNRCHQSGIYVTSYSFPQKIPKPDSSTCHQQNK